MIETVRLNEPGARTLKDARPLIREGAQVVVHYNRKTGDAMAYSATKLLKVGALADATTAEILAWFLSEDEPVKLGYDFDKHVFYAYTNDKFRREGATARQALLAYRRVCRIQKSKGPTPGFITFEHRYQEN